MKNLLICTLITFAVSMDAFALVNEEVLPSGLS